MDFQQKTSVFMYSHPSMRNLACSIAKICQDFEQQQLPGPQSKSGCAPSSCDVPSSQYGTRRVVLQEGIRWNSFADGFPNLFITDVKEIARRDLIFIASFHSPQVIFEQISVIYALPRYLARSVTVILPFFPTGTMERVEKEGQIATAKTLATLLSHTPLTARGPTQIMVFDIHALQERFYFSDNVIPRLESAIPLLLKKLKSLTDLEKISIVFPDDGATKRFSEMFKDYSNITCAKVRNGDKRDVVVKDGDPQGRHVIIVDDLVQTGGTLTECAKACLSKGATKVSCFVTHAVFPRESWRKFTIESEPALVFEKFWITDSLPHSLDIVKHAPFELLSLCDIIADRLLGYDLVSTP